MTKEIGLKVNKIKGLMAEKEISQEQLAEVLNISLTSVNLKLQGKRQFKANEISIIARYFNVEVDFLFA